LLAVGLSHQSAPVSVLERAAVGADAVNKLLGDVAGTAYVDEAVVLATCNRVEVYAHVTKFHSALDDISALLATYGELDLDELTPYLYVHYDNRVARHLFAVAAGLDSMVVGEPQVLGQIRTALDVAQRAGTAGRVLNDLVQNALRVGKRVRSETEIDHAGQSVVSVALDETRRIIGQGIAGRRAVVVGAGSMSSLAATTLHRDGVADLVIANRTYERAIRLADNLGGRAVPFTEVPAEIASADIVVSCTGSTEAVLGPEAFALRTSDAPLAVLDLALPRDVDPAVAELPGVTVVDLTLIGEASRRVADDDTSPAASDSEPGSRVVGADVVAEVWRMVSAEVARYDAATRGERVVPTITALRGKADEVVEAELARFDGRVPGLDPRARHEVERTVRRVVDKLLHTPTVRAKQFAAESGVSYADALRELFDLDPTAVHALSALADGVAADTTWRADAADETADPVSSKGNAR
jgi:glutamyl-tRNA reductase